MFIMVLGSMILIQEIPLSSNTIVRLSLKTESSEAEECGEGKRWERGGGTFV